jgi:hypothetical protein
MNILTDLFSRPPCRAEDAAELKKLMDELFVIGKQDDFLSERPGMPFSGHCRHIRAIAIGKRLDLMGGLPLMEYVHGKTRRKLGVTLAEHLSYAWTDIGKWIP